MSVEFIATSLDGTQLGEITNADERTVTLGHMKVPSAVFKIPLDHYLADTLAIQDCLIKVYRTDPRPPNARSLIFHGPVVSTQEVGESLKQSVAVTAAGPFWRLTKRIIPGSDTKSGISFGTRDLGQMAFDILAACNGAQDGFTGIWPGNLTASASGQVDKWFLKNAAEAITELSAGISSFEYVVNPTEAINRAFAWPQIGQLDAAPVIGVSRPDAIFEYGTSRANVAGYNRSVDREGVLTRAIISVNGWPDGTTQDLLASVAAPERASRGLFEEVVNDAGITDDGLRQQLVDYHIALRKQPRQVVTFSPALNAKPSPFTDYNVGDWVRGRAAVGGKIRFDATFRIWGLTLSADKNGNESVELQLVSGG